jgi:EAL domain-containing protein (putative c-di-GMP-specific phosphodiesterase class I)
VETQGELDFLKRAGCTEAQGHFSARLCRQKTLVRCWRARGCDRGCRLTVLRSSTASATATLPRELTSPTLFPRIARTPKTAFAQQVLVRNDNLAKVAGTREIAVRIPRLLECKHPVD